MFLRPTNPVLLLCLAICCGCCPNEEALALTVAAAPLPPDPVDAPPMPPSDLHGIKTGKKVARSPEQGRRRLRRHFGGLLHLQIRKQWEGRDASRPTRPFVSVVDKTNA